MAWFLGILMFAGASQGEDSAPTSPLESFMIQVLICNLSADEFARREEAFLGLQRLGRRAVPFLQAARETADFQTRLKVEYLIRHVPVQQEMIEIPGGTVRLGTSDKYCNNPEHEAVLSPYRMDRYEVTNFMYHVFIKETGHPPPPSWHDRRYPPGEENHPVTFVSYLDASAYALWAGKRLPTADEWEYAARGGDGRLYPWGDEALRGHSNIQAISWRGAVAVGSYDLDTSPFGLKDMGGNVSEWVVFNPRGGKAQPATKGSSFDMKWSVFACYQPIQKEADLKVRYVGFRCAR